RAGPRASESLAVGGGIRERCVKCPQQGKDESPETPVRLRTTRPLWKTSSCRACFETGRRGLHSIGSRESHFRNGLLAQRRGGSAGVGELAAMTGESVTSPGYSAALLLRITPGPMG